MPCSRPWLAVLLACGCTDGSELLGRSDAGVPDAMSRDAGRRDAGERDGGERDAGPRDGGQCVDGVGLCLDGRCATVVEESVAHYGHTFVDVFAASATEVFLVSEAGAVFRFDGQRTELLLEIDAAFTAIHGTSAADVYATDEVGRVHHFDGTSWSIPFQTDAPLTAVFALAPERVYVGGARGTFVTGVGDAWASEVLVGDVLDLWARAPDDVHVLATDPMRPTTAAWHFDGTGWTQRMLIDHFGAIAGDATQVVAVGPIGLTRFDGTSWTYTGGRVGYTDVAAGPSGDLFTLGREPTIRRFVGTATTAEADAFGFVASRVSAAADGSVWFVGERMLHRFEHASATPHIRTLLRGGGIADVWGWSSDEVVGVGFDGTVWHRTARGWREVESTAPKRPLVDVVAASANDVVAVGFSGTILSGPVDALRAEQLPDYPLLLSVSRGADGATFVSGNDVIARRDGGRWRTLTDATGYLTGFWSADGRVTWAVGSGDIYRREGPYWERVHVEAQGRFDDIFGFAPDDIYAVGLEVGIWHFDGASWTRVLQSPLHAHSAVWGSGPSDVYTVGASAALHFDGFTWSVVALPSFTWLSDVWGSGPDDVWITDLGGALYHFDGATWTTLGTPAGMFEAVWGTSGSDVWVVGGAVALHFDGTTWTDVTPFGEPYLRAVHGRSPSEVYAVGPAIYRWNGSQFLAETTPWIGDSLAVWWGPDDEVYVSGSPPRRRGAGDWPPLAPQGSFQDSFAAHASSTVFSNNGVSPGVYAFDGTSFTRTPRLWPAGSSVAGLFGWSERDIVMTTFDRDTYHYDGSGWSVESSLRLFGEDLHGATPNRMFSFGRTISVRENGTWRYLQEDIDLLDRASGGWAANDEELYVARGDVVHFHCR